MRRTIPARAPPRLRPGIRRLVPRTTVVASDAHRIRESGVTWRRMPPGEWSSHIHRVRSAPLEMRLPPLGESPDSFGRNHGGVKHRDSLDVRHYYFQVAA